MLYRVLKYLPILTILVASVAFTRYNYFGDSAEYIENVASAVQGSSRPGENPLWESGHLLLRPLGWGLFHLSNGLARHPLATDPRVTISWCLIGSSIVSGFITIFLLRSLAEQFLNSWAANFIATGFLCFYAFLNYLQTGTSYLIGLMWLTLSLCFAIRAAESKQSTRSAVLAGLATALAALFWLPYICALPGILATIALWNPSLDRDRIRLVFISGACAIVVLCAGYAAAIAELHLHSLSQIGQWLLASRHGWSPSKRLLRVWTGLPRSFLWLGNEGMLIKRYLLHDPYAPTTLTRIIREELWRLIAFYGFLLSLVWALIRCERGNRVLWILGLAAAPLLFFALAIFEPGSAERYLPLFPFLCLAVAFSLSSSPSLVARCVMLVFLSIAIVANVKDLWRTSLDAASRRTEERARSLQDRVGPNGLVAVVTLMDELYPFAKSLSFDPRNPVGIHLPVYDVVQIANDRVRTWRQEFASRSSRAFALDDSVWISKRLLVERPRPDWGWTEGDDARITWNELRPFFARFLYSGEVGGADGFVRLIDSPQNRQSLSVILRETADGDKQGVPR